MPDRETSNGQRTLTDWLLRLDEKLDALHVRLDRKADTSEVERLEKPVEKQKDRARHVELKLAGTASVVTARGSGSSLRFWGANGRCLLAPLVNGETD